MAALNSNNERKAFRADRIALVTFAALFLVSLIIGGIYFSKDSKNKKELNKVNLKYENMLAEKLAIEKIIDGNKIKIAKLQDQIGDLSRLLENSQKSLDQKLAEISSLKGYKSKNKKLESELQSLKQTRESLELQINSLNELVNKLKFDNETLLASIKNLESDKKKLSEDLDASLISLINNFRVETTKGKKDRLTVNSRKVKKLSVSFNIPENIASNIKFKLITPEGKEFSSLDKKIISYKVIDQPDDLASLTFNMGEFEVSKKIQMTYKPNEKMKPGLYKIAIYNNDKPLGNCEVRLR